MIIVWSWTQAHADHPFDEWYTNSTQHPLDRVIRLNERTSPKEQAVLFEVIRAYLPNSDVFVFLHRSHGYNSQNIDEILTDFSPILHNGQELKCFLFGEGNDFIYLAKNPRGLLGTKGSFSARFQQDGEEEVSPTDVDAIADLEQKLIKKEHFDAVWKYYGSAFKSKILELREILLSELLPSHYPNGKDRPSNYERIRQPEQRLLFLRLLSFVGKLRKGSDLEEELKKFEFIHKKSYLFDDCNAHFKGFNAEGQNKHYQELSNEIKNSILSQRKVTDLIAMRKHFNALLDVMPEASFY